MVSNRGMKDDSRFGVDSRWSWITAFFCAWVLFLTMATVRMSGIFFYGIVEAFRSDPSRGIVARIPGRHVDGIRRPYSWLPVSTDFLAVPSCLHARLWLV
ncbi:hypothetical protein MRX96_053761 [Rhipicephalus microplus]